MAVLASFSDKQAVLPLEPIESTWAPQTIPELRSESKHSPSDKATAPCSTNTAARPAAALLPPLQTHKGTLELLRINPLPKPQCCGARTGCSAGSSRHSPCPCINTLCKHCIKECLMPPLKTSTEYSVVMGFGIHVEEFVQIPT